METVAGENKKPFGKQFFDLCLERARQDVQVNNFVMTGSSNSQEGQKAKINLADIDKKLISLALEQILATSSSQREQLLETISSAISAVSRTIYNKGNLSSDDFKVSLLLKALEVTEAKIPKPSEQ